MDSIDAWSAWFEVNFPTKVSTEGRVKYSSLLIEHEIFDFETLLECIELEPDFLSAKICVKNPSLHNSIKVRERFDRAYFEIVYSVDFFLIAQNFQKLAQIECGSGHVLPMTPNASSKKFTDADEFEPVTNIGSDLCPALWKIDNVIKLPCSSQDRFLYSGTFTVANVTRDVFIKRQSFSLSRNDLTHEASVYRTVKTNPSLIQMFHFHPQTPQSYIVLEKFGQNLCAFLHGKSVIRMQILEELCIALTAFHGSGFVHCDIKPQNILVDSRAGSVHLKLCDFDSAELIGDFFQHVDGAMKYTEQWVSPEVYFGRGGELRVSPAMDVFSFGLIAGVLFDDAISEHKTILPRRSIDVSAFEKCLTDQVILNALMPCQRGKRFEALVHNMCSLNPGTRATLREVELAIGTTRATAIHAHNIALSKDNEFLKAEVVDKQTEIITQLRDIKASLAQLGSKITQLLQNDVELKNMMNNVINGTFDCPTLFLFVPEAANK